MAKRTCGLNLSITTDGVRVHYKVKIIVNDTYRRYYSLDKQNSEEEYAVCQSHKGICTCTCKAYIVYTHKECKHIEALRAVGLLPDDSAAPAPPKVTKTPKKPTRGH